MTPIDERALAFECEGSTLIGVLSLPGQPAARGVLIVVGGPQYRAGSHRQFTLLARHLAEQGIPAMRFDYRGMGDSAGSARDFEGVGADVRAAIDGFCASVTGLKEVVIWGLCDAASATLFYAHRDPRVCGIVILNPWVRTVEGVARTQLRHYYLRRLTDPELWRKLLGGKFDFRAAASGLTDSLRKVFGGASGGQASAAPQSGAAGDPRPLPERMLDSLGRFRGRVLLILSGNDLTAKEFVGAAERSRHWQEELGSPRVTQHELAAADHTFSTREWRDRVAAWTAEWVRSW